MKLQAPFLVLLGCAIAQAKLYNVAVTFDLHTSCSEQEEKRITGAIKSAFARSKEYQEFANFDLLTPSQRKDGEVRKLQTCGFCDYMCNAGALQYCGCCSCCQGRRRQLRANNERELEETIAEVEGLANEEVIAADLASASEGDGGISCIVANSAKVTVEEVIVH